MDTGETQACRTAVEAGWHVSRYNIKAPIPGSENTAIYNTYKRSCDEYTPDELSVMSILDQVAEDDPLIKRLARCGVIANHDERESFELMRKLGSVIAPGGAVCITICPTLACNFECPYCFEDRGRGKMAPEIQDDIVRLAERMLDASKATAHRRRLQLLQRRVFERTLRHRLHLLRGSLYPRARPWHVWQRLDDRVRVPRLPQVVYLRQADGLAG